MKKIMFNDRYGLTEAVLHGRKTMTRRIITDGDVIARHWNENLNMPHCYYRDERGLCQLLDKETWEVFKPTYKVGEVVAVAQSYSEVMKEFPYYDQLKCFRSSAAWNNKMFVTPELMPYQIRITDIRIERLQDISDEDCLREGIYQCDPRLGFDPAYTFRQEQEKHRGYGATPRAAFVYLIDKVSGKGTWERNPWVFVYEFELVK